jgi:hypothetical protein
VSIFKNGDLLQNVTPIKHEVSISGSVSIKPKLQGQLPGFEDVTIYISPETKRNILCYVDVADHYPTVIQGKTFIVESSKGSDLPSASQRNLRCFHTTPKCYWWRQSQHIGKD